MLKKSPGCAVLLVALLSTLQPVASEQAAEFELLHLWQVDIEQQALTAISDPLKEKGVTWREQSLGSNFYGVRSEYAERVAMGNPPTGVFWIAGGVRELVEDNTFRVIPDQTGTQSYQQVLLPEVYELLALRVGIGALPLGIHLQNHITYNQNIFNQLEIELPQTWQQFLNAAQIIKDAGVVPLAMSDQRWQLRFLFTSILLSYLDDSQAAVLFQRGESLQSLPIPLTKALTVLDQLREFVNPLNVNLPWQEAVRLLVSGQAAVSILGDFSSPLYGSDSRFVCALPPGNKIVLWSLDTIALSNTDDARQLVGQDHFVDVLSDPVVMQNYISRKGGIPAYRHYQFEKINLCSKQSIKAWQAASIRMPLDSLGWSRDLLVMSEVVQRFWRTPGMPVEDAVSDILESLYFLRQATAKR